METNILTKLRNIVKKSQMAGGRPVGYLQLERDRARGFELGTAEKHIEPGTYVGLQHQRPKLRCFLWGWKVKEI